jgi:glycosyltransferase involved in cell wall biosynthesis
MEVLDAQRVLDSDAYQSNAEVILVDDGSTDNSAEIIRKFRDKYTNIRYVYQDNAGQASARNAGIDVATGQYIYMMDQDDVLIPNTLFPMVQCAVEHDAEILEFIAQPTTPEAALNPSRPMARIPSSIGMQCCRLQNSW